MAKRIFYGGRRAQIGTTLTWFVAFLIIFFVLILFVIATALFSINAPSFSKAEGKAANLPNYPQEAIIGFDPGDLGLKRELFAFLNERVSSGLLVKEHMQSFDESVYNKNIRFTKEEIEDNSNYKIFYDSATSFFDKAYSECYVMCLEFGSAKPVNKQVIAGKDCPQTKNVYYDCFVSRAYIPSGIFNYAEYDMTLINGKKMKIKLLRGGISGVYS